MNQLIGLLVAALCLCFTTVQAVGQPSVTAPHGDAASVMREDGDDSAYVIYVIEHAGASIKYEDADEDLGEDGAVQTDIFVIQVQNAGDSLTVVTKASTNTAVTALSGVVEGPDNSHPGEARFTTYNLDVPVGHTWRIMDYVNAPGLSLGSDFDFVYDDGETWHLADFNNNTPVTIVTADLAGGNHGEGEYRISLRYIATGELVDHMTIRVGEAGTSVTASGLGMLDDNGFRIALVDMENGVYTIKITSESAPHALSHVTFTFSQGDFAEALYD